MPAKIVIAVGVVVTDDAGRVLLVKRRREPNRGLWSVPGGKVEPGETLEEAAAREAFEEIGYRVRVGVELWMLQIPTGNGETYQIHDFAAKVIDGSLQAGDDADDVRWFLPQEVLLLEVTDGLIGYLQEAGIVP